MEQQAISPPNFIVDSSALDGLDTHKVARDDIRQNRVQYVINGGLNKVDLFSECRALTKLDDFETMYDLTLELIEHKTVSIIMRHEDGTKSELCTFAVTDKYMDLRGIDVIDANPCLVNWLVDFIGASLLKKYPTPLPTAPKAEVKESSKTSKKT